MSLCRVAVVGFMFATLLLACGGKAVGDDTLGVDASKDLIPLAVGNRWNYKRFQYAEDGKVLGSNKQQTSVRGLLDFSSGRFFLVDVSGYGEWLANSNEGITRLDVTWDKRATSPKPVRQVPRYRLSAKVGLKYTSKFDSHGKPAEETTISELAKEVETPAGKYKCLMYEVRDVESAKLISKTYIAPGVGVVQIEYYYLDSGTLMSVNELVSFENAK